MKLVSMQKGIVMSNKYDKYKKEWNKIFSRESAKIPPKLTVGNNEIDKGISWICNGSNSIVDFGCGNGTMLCLCAMNGTKLNIGIDLSDKAIVNAKKISKKMTNGEFSFIVGGIECINNINDESVDAVILFNIIDNLHPEDAEILLNEVFRILKKNGKVLVKLNDFINNEKIQELGIRVIKDNLLDDGLLLLNNSTKEWTSFFENKFTIKHYRRVYYEEYNEFNRMFYLVKDIF